MKKCDLASEMMEISAEPMTPECMQVLAYMGYLYRHWEDLPLQTEEYPDKVSPLTKEEAEQWVKGMENADGTHGRHWTMEQTEHARIQHGIACDSVEFWAAMNMMYSDYCKVAEKFGVGTPDFYACMAKAFLDDKDAKPDKLARYREYVAE